MSRVPLQEESVLDEMQSVADRRVGTTILTVYWAKYTKAAHTKEPSSNRFADTRFSAGRNWSEML
jgi:hypothetical protein